MSMLFLLLRIILYPEDDTMKTSNIMKVSHYISQYISIRFTSEPYSFLPLYLNKTTIRQLDMMARWTALTTAIRQSKTMTLPCCTKYTSVHVQMLSPAKCPVSMNSSHWYLDIPLQVPVETDGSAKPVQRYDQWDMLHVLWSRSCCVCVHQQIAQLASPAVGSHKEVALCALCQGD